MGLTIYDREGNPRAELSANDSSTQAKEIQGDNVLTLSFTLYEHVALDVDDYVDFEDERYWLTEQYRPKQISEREWRYELKLYGIESLIRNILVIKRVDGENDPVFSLTAPPREHVAMIANCMNEAWGGISDWKVGQVDGTENITIDYHGKYCDEALKDVAEKVEAEWWVEGQTINVCRCEHGEPITLGYNNGLTVIEPDKADNVKFYTRLWPVGSSRNIDPEKYGFSRLQLPDGLKYVEVNADKYGRVDHYEDAAFADIYPRRIGTVSSVRSEVKKGEDGKDFTIYYFMDYSLTFNPNDYMIGGKVFRVSFQQGSELGGLGDEEDGTYYFEVNYNADTREFEIITIWPYDNDVQLPGGTLIPKLGDKYILWNLRMPDEYYRLAEAEFLEAVNKYNDEHALDISVFKASTDHVWIEDQSAELFVGRRVRLESDRYFPGAGYRDSRITRITRKVNLPSQMDIEIGDALGRTSKVKFADDISSVRSYAQSIAGSISLPDIVRTGDRTRLTDNNLMSALRIDKSYLSKVKDDRSAHRISTDMAFEAGRYIAGASGGIFGMDVNGDSFAEVARLYVRVKAFFEELTVVKAGVLAGKQYITPGGGIKCTRVENVTDDFGTLMIYRCYFLSGQDGEMTECKFVAGDQAISEMFNAKDGTANKVSNHRYWRLVADVNNDAYTDESGNHYGYIDLLVDNCEDGSDIPQAGDEICQLGNRYDPDRRSAMVFSTVDTDAPSVKLYGGIGSGETNAEQYSLNGRAIIAFGRDPLSGKIFFRLGATGATQYLEYTQDCGLTVAGTISTQSVFDDGQGNRRGVAEYVEKVAGGVFGTLATRNIALESGRWERIATGSYAKFADAGLFAWDRWKRMGALSFDAGRMSVERTSERSEGFCEKLSVNTLDKGMHVCIRVKGSVSGLADIADRVNILLADITAEDGAKHHFATISANGDFEITAEGEIETEIANPCMRFDYADANVGTKVTLDHTEVYIGERIPSMWTAAPEDIQYLEAALRKARADSSVFDGGLMLSTMLQLGMTDVDGVRRIYSGLSGVNRQSAGSDIALWLGGDPFTAQTDPAQAPRTQLLHNGTGYFARRVIQVSKDALEILDPEKSIQNDQTKVRLDKTGLHLINSAGEEILQVANVEISATTAAGTTHTSQTSASAQLVYRESAVHKFTPCGPWDMTAKFASNNSPVIESDNATLTATISLHITADSSWNIPLGTRPYFEWEFIVGYADGSEDMMTASGVYKEIVNGGSTYDYTFRLTPDKGKIVTFVSIANSNGVSSAAGGAIKGATVRMTAKVAITYGLHNRTTIGNNGIMAAQGGAKLLCLRPVLGDEGETEMSFTGATGTFGLKVSESGFKYIKPGSSEWKAWDPAT